MSNIIVSDERWLLPEGGQSTFSGSRLVGVSEVFVLNDMQHMNGVAGLSEQQLVDRGIVKMQARPDETLVIASPDFSNPGAWSVTPRPAQEVIAIYQREVEKKIEAVAADRNYSSSVSAASYVASTNEQWAAEASAFVSWRDAVWAAVFVVLSQVQAGQMQPPQISELLAGLPAIEWPAA